jgi:AcrR family transcriptional regulator
MGVNDTSLKIIDATIEVLNEEGLSGTTTIKIAKKAKVSEVTIFRKFKNKNNLIEKSKEVYLQRFLKKIDQLLDVSENQDLKDYIRELWFESQRIFDDEINLIKISIEEVNNNQIDQMVLPKFSEKIILNLTKIFQEQIDKGKIRTINPTVAALTIYSVMFESLILLKIYGVKLEQTEESYVEDFLNIFLNGISN